MGGLLGLTARYALSPAAAGDINGRGAEDRRQSVESSNIFDPAVGRSAVAADLI